jgi:hypothetical protein
MLVYLDCLFFCPSLSLLLFERKSYAFPFVVFEMHFMFVYISVQWFNCLCSFFFSCSTVPVIHSTEAGLRRVFRVIFFRYMYVFLLLSFFLLFVMDGFLFRASLWYCTLKKKRRDRTIEYSQKKERNNRIVNCKKQSIIDTKHALWEGKNTTNCLYRTEKKKKRTVIAQRRSKNRQKKKKRARDIIEYKVRLYRQSYIRMQYV